MIIEVIAILLLVFGGVALLGAVGFSGWMLIPVSFVVGICLYVSISYLQALVGLSSSPLVTFGILFGISTVLFTYIGLTRGYKITINIAVAAILSIIGLLALITVIRAANLVEYHYDSIRYLIVGSLIESNNLDWISPNLLRKRYSSVAILHAPANLAGEFYLRSLHPLVGLSTLGLLFWFSYEGLKQAIPRKEAIAFALIGTLLLLTNSGFVWHSFYINGHLLVAAFLLVVVGTGWLAASDSGSRRELLCLQAVGVAGLVLSRPEGALIAPLALLPTLLWGKIPLSSRWAILAVFGVAVVVQQGFIMLTTASLGQSVRMRAWLLFGVGLGALLALPVLAWSFVTRHSKYVLAAVEGLLWVALIGFSLARPVLLQQSLDATLRNIVFDAGEWGASLMILAALVIGAILLTDAPNRIFLRFPLTACIPMFLLFAFLRGGPYRVGATDSLNRMLIHLVPLAILFVISAAASKRWGVATWQREERSHPSS